MKNETDSKKLDEVISQLKEARGNLLVSRRYLRDVEDEAWFMELMNVRLGDTLDSMQTCIKLLSLKREEL